MVRALLGEETFFWYCRSLSRCNLRLGNSQMEGERQEGYKLQNGAVLRCYLGSRLVSPHVREVERIILTYVGLLRYYQTLRRLTTAMLPRIQ